MVIWKLYYNSSYTIFYYIPEVIVVMRYAVKFRDTWYIAKKVKASYYGSPNIGVMNLNADQLVWLECDTTDFLCFVGNETRFVELDREDDER